MHAAALGWIAQHASTDAVRVLDVGGRDINGSPRGLFPNATEYIVVDPVDHSSVDIVADVLKLKATGKTKMSVGTFDVIIYAEVAEHADNWADHVAHMIDLLNDGGRLVVTAAGPTRAPHSAYDGAEVRPDEHYQNVSPDALSDALYLIGDQFTVEELGDDVRAVFVKG